MEEIITKDNLDTYTQGLKGVLSSMGEAINNNSAIDLIEDKIDNIQTDVTAIKTAVTTQLVTGQVVTVHIDGGDGEEYVNITSGDTVIANLHDGDSVTIPIGVSYTISHHGWLIDTPSNTSKSANNLGYTHNVSANYVGLGLPSGNIWDRRNVGANNSTSEGKCFMWGDNDGAWYINGTSDVTQSNYSSGYFGKGHELTTSIPSNGYQYDGAVNHGRGRIPTKAEWQELIDNCTWTWKSVSGISGYEITGSNGKTMFLPAVGYAEDGTWWEDGLRCAYTVSDYRSSNDCYVFWANYSSIGFNVIPRRCGTAIRSIFTAHR